MQSRTAEGKHTKRFIVEFKSYDGVWTRSGNDNIYGFFTTREEAQTAMEENKNIDMQYRVRMK